MNQPLLASPFLPTELSTSRTRPRRSSPGRALRDRRTPPTSEPTVVLFRRKPLPGQFSLELVFDDVIAALPDSLNAIDRELPFPSNGVVNRARNMLFAARHRGTVNHVTGDVHYLALALPRRTSVLTIADTVSLGRLSGIRRWVFEVLWYRIPLWWCARVTVISQATRDSLVERFPWSESKIEVVGCPVSSAFRRSPRPPNSPPVVLQVGAGPNKNLDRVVDALDGRPVHLRIIGSLTADQRRHLDRSGLSWSNAVDLTLEEMTAEYRSCDLVVFASTYEGFGLPIVEAQASGRPVVTSEIPPMCDVAGAGAVLVDPFDSAGIGDAVARLLDDEALYERVVSAGMDSVKRWAPRSIAEQYAAIYEAVCRWRTS